MTTDIRCFHIVINVNTIVWNFRAFLRCQQYIIYVKSNKSQYFKFLRTCLIELQYKEKTEINKNRSYRVNIPGFFRIVNKSTKEIGKLAFQFPATEHDSLPETTYWNWRFDDRYKIFRRKVVSDTKK